MRMLILIVMAYLVYRILRMIFLPPKSPGMRSQGNARPTPRARRHASDFSDVQDADFEDITPPPPGGPSPRQ